MRAVIKTGSLIHWLRFSDKIMGSSEYSFGNIFLSYKDGLVMRATDGCLTCWMKIAECEPFYGEIPVGLRLLKGFLTGEKSQEVYFTILPDQIVLQGYQETLRIKTSQPKDREHMKPFRQIGRTRLTKFMNFLDFATAALEEGDMTHLTSLEKSLVMISPSRTIVSLCKVDDGIDEEFSFSIPYVSSRHIVKALKVYERDCPMALGVGEASFSLICDDFAMQVCGEKDSRQGEIEQVLVRGDTYQLYTAFTKFISKAAWLLPKDTPLRIAGTEKKIYFFGSYGTVQYRAELDMGFQKSFEIEISPHRLRSALSRMGSRIFLAVFDEFVRIEDQRGRYVLIKITKG
ncbi:MAG TPA: hypothetical protein PLP64_09590 [Pseudothermotoga sp.]|nr:hypothetical protein [Pseudothermotoga sp.]HOK84459.1 hypothetical protein [Pseudothermotoga sp.]HPP70939.1 hypothetical protein [Pseudothermotoga sp.]